MRSVYEQSKCLTGYLLVDICLSTRCGIPRYNSLLTNRHENLKFHTEDSTEYMRLLKVAL
jgi:hypothetical protein